MYFVCVPCTNKFVYEERCPVADGEYQGKLIFGGEVTVPITAFEFVEFDESDGEPSDDNEVMKGYSDLCFWVDDNAYYASLTGRCPHCGDSMFTPYTFG